MKRRTFLTVPFVAGVLPAASMVPVFPASGEPTVIATTDGISFSPAEYSSLLQQLSTGLAPDGYSLGGIVQQLEEAVAAALGKECAVWLPTGTLANHLAVRLLAGEKRRVLVQEQSHLYNDCGDCCQTLSGLNLVPLAPGKATFTLEDVEQEAARSASGRVSVSIGAIQVETPVRRKTGEAFDVAEMKRVAQWARDRNIGLHLDGARLFLAAAYSGVGVREYTDLFDTVYVSMYKYFNAASGAILAGPKKLLGDLFHTRRMFGGGLYSVWPFAAVALHYFNGFPERYSKAVSVSERIVAALQRDSRFTVTRIPNGTNIFYLQVNGVNAPAYYQRLHDAGVVLPAPNRNGRFTVVVNETWNRAAPEDTLDRFQKAGT